MNKIEKKYIAPNVITATNMLLGFLSILSSINGNFHKAAWFIVVAMICDGLDGKAARKLEAYSEFGKEFDSFCDAISFGLAPALFVYTYLSSLPLHNDQFVPIISFIYALCGVVRLVKFNVTTVPSSTKSDFSGMPIPTAAAVIVSYFLFSQGIFKKTLFLDFFQILVLFASILMVSHIRFRSPGRTYFFIPKKVGVVLSVLILITVKYSLFLLTYSYIIINLLFHLYKNVFMEFKSKRDRNPFNEKEI